jgi:hypothetical protein
MFPLTDPTNISDSSFLLRLSQTQVPYYLCKQRYSQFCIETNRTPDWPLFRTILDPRPVRT